MATVGNIDWPSRPGLAPDAQRREAVAILDLAVRTGLNAAILQVRASADAFYASPFEPWSAYLTGEQGRAPDPPYDPLAFWCDAAHDRGLLLHAWFNPFRARVAGARYEESAGHVARSRPDLVRPYGSALWLDPGEPEARDLTLKVVLDLVRRYDLDGIHIDDYFYPYPIPDPAHPGQELPFPDDASWAKAQAAGVTGSRGDWRRQNISGLIERINAESKAIKPQILFGISPFGIPRPGQPAVARGFDQYDKLAADALLWLEKGWADYFAPQLYWKVDAPGQPFQPLLDYWIAANPKGRHIWPGLSISRVSDRPDGYAPEEILRQIALIRATPGATGQVLFSFKSLPANRRGIADRLREAPYREPALVPLTPWITAKAPAPPLIEGETIRPAPSESPFLWAIHARAEAGSTFRLRPARPTRIEPGEDAVMAVDRLGNLSEAVTLPAGR